MEDILSELRLHIDTAEEGNKSSQKIMSKASFRLVRNATGIKNMIKELKPYGKKR